MLCSLRGQCRCDQGHSLGLSFNRAGRAESGVHWIYVHVGMTVTSVSVFPGLFTVGDGGSSQIQRFAFSYAATPNSHHPGWPILYDMRLPTSLAHFDLCSTRRLVVSGYHKMQFGSDKTVVHMQSSLLVVPVRSMVWKAFLKCGGSPSPAEPVRLIRV
jgi:hypothetical protein